MDEEAAVEFEEDAGIEEVAVADDEPQEEMQDSASNLILPRATILKLMKEAAPEGRFSPELQVAINRCCSIFLLYISDGAQDLAREKSKKAITVVEASAALVESGFAEIAEEVRREMKLENLTAKKRKRAN
jgi:histone H3/H4